VHFLLKHRIVIAVNVLIFGLIVITSLQWKQSPVGLEGINLLRLAHLSAHIILIPFFTLYLPLKLLKSRYSSTKKAYLYGLLLCVCSGLISAAYTHSISTPGSFLIKLDGGVYPQSDPRYNANDPKDSYINITISTDVEGYTKPTNDHYFFVEAFLHFLFYCCYMLSYLQVVGLLHKRKLKSQLKQQQLDALQYQLNPHFLFNSLNSIRGMLYEDVSEAKKLLGEFRQLFKHLFNNKKHCITVNEEILLCRHYLQLEAVRFEERLTVNWSIADNLNGYLVPSMSVFTLIENAIKHGIANITHSGSIDISISEQSKKLVIVISNSLNIDARQADGTRTGLSNLETRLGLLYQDNFSLNTERSNDRFIVELVVPLKKGVKYV
jgi:hypothetical protein